MDIDNIVQKIVLTYKASRPLYHNYEYLYKNQTPLCPPPYRRLYDFFVWLNNNTPEVLVDISESISKNHFALSIATISYLKDYVPEKYKNEANLMLFIFTVTEIIIKENDSQQKNSSNIKM